MAIENGWEGVIINGAIRDVVAMSQMDLGIKALGTSPFKTDKRGVGEVNVTLTLHNQMVQPGDYLYADWNGILLSEQSLTLA
jgi:regulator of ribonuclease activity A